jgi:hypothetical protein
MDCTNYQTCLMAALRVPERIAVLLAREENVVQL